MTLPPAATLIDMVKRAGPDSLDAFAPDIDQLATTAEIAAWLNRSPQTIRREQFRPRADGSRWPPPDKRFGRASAWTYRTIVIYRASMPGSGNRTERTV